MQKDLLKLLVLVIIYTVVESTMFKDCGSKGGKVATVSVSNCPGNKPCPLKKGTNATVNVTFAAVENAKQLKASVHGVIADIPVPFTPPNTNGCKDSGIACPVVSGKTYHYHAVIPVLKSYPTLELEVKWELQDEKKNDVFCIAIPCQIVN